jgi:hypothetical protein
VDAGSWILLPCKPIPALRGNVQGLIAMNKHEVKILGIVALQVLDELHSAYLVRTPVRDQRG